MSLANRFIGRIKKGDGTFEYRSVPASEVKRRIRSFKAKPAMDVLRRRIRELHPDKLGKDQSAAQREEFTRLQQELDEMRRHIRDS